MSVCIGLGAHTVVAHDGESIPWVEFAVGSLDPPRIAVSRIDSASDRKCRGRRGAPIGRSRKGVVTLDHASQSNRKPCSGGTSLILDSLYDASWVGSGGKLRRADVPTVWVL